MGFSDPQTVTVNAVAQTLARTANLDAGSVFTTADGNYRLTVSHQTTGKRVRHLVRIDNRKIAADPLLGSVNIEYSMSVQLVIDVPKIGYTVAEAKLVADGILAYLTASSGANVTKVLGGEI